MTKNAETKMIYTKNTETEMIYIDRLTFLSLSSSNEQGFSQGRN